jgi:DNA-binding MarR family transcriptional regulator
MDRQKAKDSEICGRSGVAFLLAQLGAHAAGRFGERLSGLGLAPPDAGVMKKIASSPGISQQALAEHLGVMPSRMVALIDELEGKKLVDRVSSPEDRRMYALRLTARGQQVVAEIGRIALEHERDLCSALTEKERETLAALCSRIATHQGLTPGVHPGYRTLGKRPA